MSGSREWRHDRIHEVYRHGRGVSTFLNSEKTLMHRNLDMSEVSIGADTVGEPSASSQYSGPTWRVTHDFLSHVLTLSHGVVILGSGALTDLFLWRQSPFQVDFSKAAIGTCAVYVLLFMVFGNSPRSSHTNAFVDYLKSFIAWTLAIFLLVLVAFALKVSDQYSRIGAAFFAVTGLAAITAVNVIVSRFIAARLKKRSIAFTRMQIVALRPHTAQYEAVWTPPPGIELTGRHSIPVSTNGFSERCREVRVILQRAVAEGRCDQILLTALWQDADYIAALLREFGPLPAPVILLSDPALVGLNRHRKVNFGEDIGFELQSAPLGLGARWAKRAVDLIVATTAILFLSPMMLLAVAAIWLETGPPILFCQDRRGFGGVPFKILKFRSMTVIENGADIPQAKRQDARITAVGQILRRKSIDELPQLFNVLKGEMSIVGPRPHAMAHDDYYDRFIEHYAFRHHVKPGITGWAQVNGLRGATETPELMQSRVEHDLWYINHWSIWLDAKIIFLTALKVFFDDNAY